MLTADPNRAAFTRDEQVARLSVGDMFDLLVIGGGATGAGIAVDAATRGYRVALCERDDFGQGTSSRSTKLVHGGVRYLQQGDVRLVRDALYERGLLLQNAPHLVYRLPTVLPLYRWWERPYYRVGLAVYDLLAGKLGLGHSEGLSRAKTIEALPTIRQSGLRGGVRYYDGGFNDSRLLLNLIQTAVDHGAVCANYTPVVGLLRDQGRVVGAEVTDRESGVSFEVRAKCVVNAAGPFSDAIRKLADPDADSWVRPSQGIHLVFDRTLLPGDNAMILPKTTDGRVVFAIPWHGHTLVGTTDTGLTSVPHEPIALRNEIDFLRETVAGCLDVPVAEADVRSVFAGLRPLVRKGSKGPTSRVGRDHTVRVDTQGMVTVLGGKWTTYRKMAEETVDRCAKVAGLKTAACQTRSLPIRSSSSDHNDRLSPYRLYAAAIRQLLADDPQHSELLDAEHTYTVGEALWAIRFEMARTVEDVLTRRLRLLLVDVASARSTAPLVASLIAKERGLAPVWISEELARFDQLAAGYTVQGCLGSIS